jgi:dTDP-3-amino-3,4,6-trideoxy-alpha-D-glucose transaminase
MIPFFDLSSMHDRMRPELLDAFQRVVAGSNFIAGRELEAFEHEFAAYCGTRHCVGVGNGLDALVIALKASGIGRGDEVLVPSQTFVATWLAVTMAGATPVPVEIDARTYCMDPERIGAHISPRTKAVIPVHLYGLPASMSRIREVAEQHGLFVLEDAAQAHGARLCGARTGTLGHAAAFSFYPTKNLGALGDAGAIVTDDESLARVARKLRNYGSETKYVHEIEGANSRLDEMQAALLRCKLPYLDEWNDKRKHAAQCYTDGLKPIEALTLPHIPDDSEHVFHQYVIRTDERDALASFLRSRCIGNAIHYPIPPHLQPAFASMNLKAGSLPVAEAAAHETLSLPMWPDISEDAVQTVIEGIHAFYTSR